MASQIPFLTSSRPSDASQLNRWGKMGKRWGKDGEKMGKRWGKDGEKMGKRWGKGKWNHPGNLLSPRVSIIVLRCFMLDVAHVADVADVAHVHHLHQHLIQVTVNPSHTAFLPPKNRMFCLKKRSGFTNRTRWALPDTAGDSHLLAAGTLRGRGKQEHIASWSVASQGKVMDRWWWYPLVI